MSSWLLAAALLWFAAPSEHPPQATAGIVDADHDGLDDALEAALLERFRPAFLVSSHDCDQLPAEFAPALPAAFVGRAATPRAVARNGTIYGQVFPRGESGGAELIEAHYYHLWRRDCGARGHDFDAEHVSVLLAAASRSAPAEDWTARTWYAAAHQQTMCDVSRFEPAARLGAEQHGATVWISAGKHASYLSAESCGGGCGKDRCESITPLTSAGNVVNVGEAGAPLNGAGWTASPLWPLADKMRTDFPDTLLAADAVAPEAPLSRRSAQAVIGSGSSAQQHSGAALDTAGRQTAHGVGVGKQKSGRSIKRALGATGRFFGLNGKAKAPKPEEPPKQ